MSSSSSSSSCCCWPIGLQGPRTNGATDLRFYLQNPRCRTVLFPEVSLYKIWISIIRMFQKPGILNVMSRFPDIQRAWSYGFVGIGLHHGNYAALHRASLSYSICVHVGGHLVTTRGI